ncbi:MAG: hypothetical protein IJD39_05150 [Clostridia bacterium]|nr:hypothetical protein [Clostridia bacterium]
MYQIISDSSYLTSEEENGKQKDTHTGVKQWHYFATDIIAEEMSGDKKTYTVFIDVKEKSSENFVYTYYALNKEKSAKLRSSVPAAHRGKTEVNNDKAIAAAAGALGISGPSELKHTSVNSYIAENIDSVKEKNLGKFDEKILISVTAFSPPTNPSRMLGRMRNYPPRWPQTRMRRRRCRWCRSCTAWQPKGKDTWGMW